MRNQLDPQEYTSYTTNKLPISKWAIVEVRQDGKKHLTRLAVFGIAGLIVFFLIIFSLFGLGGRSLSLKTYDADGFSVSVPAAYIEATDGGQTYFKEDTKDDKAQSAVGAGAEMFGEQITTEQLVELRSTYNDDFIKNELTYFGENTSKITDVKSNLTDADDSFVYSGSATYEQDGKSAGKMYYTFTFNTYGYEYVIVKAHEGDKALDEQAQTIITSLVNTDRIEQEDYPEDFAE